MEIFDSYMPSDTYERAKLIAKDAKAGDIYTLSGELGAGKTLFAQGFAAGLGINSHVVSPTFALMNIHEGNKLPLYHFDMYRLEDDADLESIGHEDYFYASGVCLVEWPERVKNSIPPNAVWFEISSDLAHGDDYREITIL